jgi:hypothetical protein
MNFECHITVHVRHAERATLHAKDLHWKTSQIDGDPVLGKKPFFYLTTHSDNAPEMFARMKRAVDALQFDGIHVIRSKIELIIHDEITPEEVPHAVA